jgi:sugar phosphate permease
MSILFMTMMASYCCIFTVGMTSPLIMKDLELNESQFAYILSVARSFRIIPKLFSGIIVDMFGGIKTFVFGNLFTCIFTLLFAHGYSVNYLALMWTGNNISTTIVWPALVKISSKWFSYKILGKVMAILSLSYLFGDGAAKIYLSAFIYFGVGWRILFHIAALTLFVFVVVSHFALISSPSNVGLEEPEADPTNLFGSEGNSDEFLGFRQSILPLVFSGSFWLLVLQAGGLNMLIYICNDWLSLYLKQQCSSTDFLAVLSTILFPITGGFSALFVGQLFDKLSADRRNFLMIAFHVLTTLIVILIYVTNRSYEIGQVSKLTTMLLFGLLGFTVTGPYTLPSGVLSIKYGGKKIAATMVGIIDTVGTIASLFSSLLGATFLNLHNVNTQDRWSKVFVAMLFDALFVLVLSTLYYATERSSSRTKHIHRK